MRIVSEGISGKDTWNAPNVFMDVLSGQGVPIDGGPLDDEALVMRIMTTIRGDDAMNNDGGNSRPYRHSSRRRSVMWMVSACACFQPLGAIVVTSGTKALVLSERREAVMFMDGSTEIVLRCG